MVCRPAEALNFYSGHPDVCAAIIIIYIFGIIKVILFNFENMCIITEKLEVRIKYYITLRII